MKKAIVWTIALALAGLLGWQIYRKLTVVKQAQGGQRSAGALAIEAVAVRRATIRDVGMFTGTLLPRSQFIVAPKIAGRLEKLLVDVADPVTRGQLIAVLDAEEYGRQAEQARAEWEFAKAGAEEVRLSAALADEEFAQKVGQAQAELGIAKATVAETLSALNVAKREFERAEALLGKTILSQAEYDTVEARFEAAKAKHEVTLAQVTERGAALAAAQVRLSENQKSARTAQYQVALAQVAQKEAAYKAAEVRLSYTRIKVPAWEDQQEARVIGERFVDAGAMLKANDPIVSVLDITVLKGVTHVTERDYPKVRPGQEVTVTTDAVADRAFTGRIVRVAPLLEEASRQGRVEIDVPNPERLLKPGMFIHTQVEFSKRENASVVPYSSLVKRDGQQGIFLADAGERKAHFVPVMVGLVEGDLAEIVKPEVSGLVVTLGQHLLEEGASILLPETNPEGAPEGSSSPAAPQEGKPTEPGGRR